MESFVGHGKLFWKSCGKSRVSLIIQSLIIQLTAEMASDLWLINFLYEKNFSSGFLVIIGE